MPTLFQVTRLSQTKKYGASSEKMAAAYAAFANGGIYHKPMYINKIVLVTVVQKSTLILAHVP